MNWHRSKRRKRNNVKSGKRRRKLKPTMECLQKITLLRNKIGVMMISCDLPSPWWRELRRGKLIVELSGITNWNDNDNDNSQASAPPIHDHSRRIWIGQQELGIIMQRPTSTSDCQWSISTLVIVLFACIMRPCRPSYSGTKSGLLPPPKPL